ncbi:hypothetical protein HNY73_016153 [Argiope bruennichi]|uniref:Uncharacterized protein n=1 Tax=Argiope bruennichi TaxID=94029 RepID=A0A8T0EJ43_ARGBR|nr:hypothetical protein HNY73_016153 [Argiope bruennichi]
MLAYIKRLGILGTSISETSCLVCCSCAIVVSTYQKWMVKRQVAWQRETVYSIACLAEQLERTCGEVARRTFLTLLEKVKSVIREESIVEDPLSFKRSFLEYLELEDKISELYRFVFETFRMHY